MKALKMISLLVMMIIAASALAAEPISSMAPVDHVYSPKGFDSNDNVEVVVEGHLPNLCWKSPKAEVMISGKNININIKALNYESENIFCAEAIVPYLVPVQVGLLDKGNYKVMVNGIEDSSMYISESSSDAVDDHVYANVEYIERNEGSRMVQLKGYNPSECFVFDQIEVSNNGADVYSILPVMEQVSDFCPMKMVPFSIDMEVPNDLESQKVLLHVRAMDGKSVNALFINK
ncbi:MAG: hypothetical protein KC493_12895 [Bacteriovoracaceae bacterium]|nr:hypothetical protein [Bacteriovoracaceae bacterium]